MKNLILGFLLAVSVQVLAADVDGSVTYKLPDGNLVDRDVTISVPARGQGEVVLKGNGFELTTKKFKSVEVLGRQVFTAVFKSDFQGKKSKLILKGTYMRGDNRLLYQGDMYKKKKGENKLKHIGVFDFNYER